MTHVIIIHVQEHLLCCCTAGNCHAEISPGCSTDNKHNRLHWLRNSKWSFNYSVYRTTRTWNHCQHLPLVIWQCKTWLQSTFSFQEHLLVPVSVMILVQTLISTLSLSSMGIILIPVLIIKNSLWLLHYYHSSLIDTLTFLDRTTVICFFIAMLIIIECVVGWLCFLNPF